MLYYIKNFKGQNFNNLSQLQFSSVFSKNQHIFKPQSRPSIGCKKFQKRMKTHEVIAVFVKLVLNLSEFTNKS